MTELESLGKEYYELLGQQQFVEEQMDLQHTGPAPGGIGSAGAGQQQWCYYL